MTHKALSTLSAALLFFALALTGTAAFACDGGDDDDKSVVASCSCDGGDDDEKSIIACDGGDDESIV